MVRCPRIFLIVVSASFVLLIIFMFASFNTNSNSVSDTFINNQNYYLSIDPDESSLKGSV